MATTCERHVEVTEKLDNHEGRIQTLEISDATMGANIVNLTRSVNELVGWLKAIFLCILAAAVGFFIWYIESV